TGALERPFPIPGWTLPGVMTAGAAQILLKSAGLVTGGRTVLAGCGPLLWLIARQYLDAGGKIEAILETTAGANRARAARHAVSFLFSSYLREGLALMREVKRRVRVISGISSLRAMGEQRAQSVAFRRGADKEEEVMPLETLLLHQGVVPNVNLAMSV